MRGANFTAAGTVTVSGVALDIENEPVPGTFAGHDHSCGPVTDPCVCDGPIIWIADGDLRRESRTDSPCPLQPASGRPRRAWRWRPDSFAGDVVGQFTHDVVVAGAPARGEVTQARTKR